MKTVRFGVAVLIGVLVLLTLLAMVVQPLMPWLVALFVLAVVYGVLIRD